MCCNIEGFIPAACKIVSREDSDKDSEETRGMVNKKRIRTVGGTKVDACIR